VRGRVLHLEAHVARIVRDTSLLGLGALAPETARRALEELARRTFPDREGVVRLEARAAAGAEPELVGTSRELGPEPALWRAAIAGEPHPGPSPWSLVKSNQRGYYERSLATVLATGADEALLFDAGGALVEGARTNLVVVLADGRPRTPPLARGGQAGIGRTLALERVAELCEGDVHRDELPAVREIVALNAVRGACAIVAVGERPVADGRPGPWAARLSAALAAD
jgi:branched-subunit amino acid aminotransferase/4-amino-4-deoxychorismate lyase